MIRCNFLPEEFPVTIEALHPETREVLWSATIEQPADVGLLRIPPLGRQLGHPVHILIRFGTGQQLSSNT